MLNIRSIAPFLLISVSGVLLFGFEQQLIGYLSLLLALGISATSGKQLYRDISVVVVGVLIVSIAPISTDISPQHMAIMAVIMTAAFLIPYLISRYIYEDHTVKFPLGLKEPWGKTKWLYLLLVLVVGYAILPLYMIGTGMYLNWPAANDASSIFSLFIGTNALGIWDELFFICIIFTVFVKYLPFWVANLLQATLFTSFLYELGFEGIGPFMIYLFALTQGYIFKVTHSLFYLLCVHLLFDFILFLVLIHAYDRTFLPIFLY